MKLKKQFGQSIRDSRSLQKNWELGIAILVFSPIPNRVNWGAEKVSMYHMYVPGRPEVTCRQVPVRQVGIAHKR